MDEKESFISRALPTLIAIAMIVTPAFVFAI
jgi:hypothetical protein